MLALWPAVAIIMPSWRHRVNPAFEQLKVDRIHVAPRALELSPLAARQRFPHIWAPLEELLARLQALPAGLVRFWLQQPHGHVVITHLPSCYEAGEQPQKHRMLCSVAYIAVSDLAKSSLEALVPVGHLLDHLLGSGGEETLWLSEGGGVCPALRKVGARMVKLFPLGHAFDAAARNDAHAYFARSLALYLYDRRALNVADPLMEKLLHTTLCSDAFWRSSTWNHEDTKDAKAE